MGEPMPNHEATETPRKAPKKLRDSVSQWFKRLNELLGLMANLQKHFTIQILGVPGSVGAVIQI